MSQQPASQMGEDSPHLIWHVEFLKKRIPTYLKRTGSAAMRAVVFVHGLNGTATGSWGRFVELARTDPFLTEADLYFYGYDSIFPNLAENARDFRAFLTQVFPEPHSVVAPRRILESEHGLAYGARCIERDAPYEELVLVGHSLGGLVIRQALVQLSQDQNSDLPPMHVRLFAPALGGVNLSGVRGLLNPMLPLVRAFSGSLTDLQARSVVLQRLATQTEELAKSCDLDPSPFESTNIWAENDDVVSPHNYLSDTSIDAGHSTNHRTVCKPTTPSYLLPIEVVCTR